MKKPFALLLAFSMTFLVACSGMQSSTETPTEVTGTISPDASDGAGGDEIDLLIFDIEGDALSAIPVTIDFDDMSVSAHEAIYTCSSENTVYDRFEPCYMTDGRLVLPLEPNEISFTGCVEQKAQNTLYFEGYTLTHSSEGGTFSVSRDGEAVCAEIGLSYDGNSVTPASFYVDDNGSIIILGYCTGDMMSTSVVSLVYSAESGEWGLSNGCAYPNEWNDFGGQLSLGPLENSVSASSELGGFLLNEGRNLFPLSPHEGSVSKILSEEDIETALPYLDTHRESYGFFHDFGYQNGHYIATFQTFNAVSGMYAVLYSETGEYEGYFLCNEIGVTLFDAANAASSTVEIEEPLPQVYIPDEQI